MHCHAPLKTHGTRRKVRWPYRRCVRRDHTARKFADVFAELRQLLLRHDARGVFTWQYRHVRLPQQRARAHGAEGVSPQARETGDWFGASRAVFSTGPRTDSRHQWSTSMGTSPNTRVGPRRDSGCDCSRLRPDQCVFIWLRIGGWHRHRLADPWLLRVRTGKLITCR